MDQERMFQIINFDINTGKVTKEEELEAYTMYFKLLDVDVKNIDGTYKLLDNIFEEAHNNLCHHKM